MPPHMLLTLTPTKPSTTLESTFQRIPLHDKILLLGDYSARFGSEHNIWANITGKHRIGINNCFWLLNSLHYT